MQQQKMHEVLQRHHVSYSIFPMGEHGDSRCSSKEVQKVASQRSQLQKANDQFQLLCKRHQSMSRQMLLETMWNHKIYDIIQSSFDPFPCQWNVLLHLLQIVLINVMVKGLTFGRQSQVIFWLKYHSERTKKYT